jgi:hypothetical protein
MPARPVGSASTSRSWPAGPQTRAQDRSSAQRAGIDETCSRRGPLHSCSAVIFLVGLPFRITGNRLVDHQNLNDGWAARVR